MLIDAMSCASQSTVDLRPKLQKWGLEPRTQGSRGTCSVFAVTGALEYALAVQRGKGERLSVEFLNWAAHRATRRRTDGGFFSDIWKGYQAFGICPEAALRYQSRFDRRLQPADEVLAAASALKFPDLRLKWVKEWDVRTGATGEHLRQIRQVIDAGWPVCAGMRWPKRESWQRPEGYEGGVLSVPAAEEVYDGHSVLLVGYCSDMDLAGGGAFLIRNTAGPARHAWIPYAYLEGFLNDAAWIASEKSP